MLTDIVPTLRRNILVEKPFFYQSIHLRVFWSLYVPPLPPPADIHTIVHMRYIYYYRIILINKDLVLSVQETCFPFLNLNFISIEYKRKQSFNLYF